MTVCMYDNYYMKYEIQRIHSIYIMFPTVSYIHNVVLYIRHTSCSNGVLSLL